MVTLDYLSMCVRDSLRVCRHRLDALHGRSSVSRFCYFERHCAVILWHRVWPVSGACDSERRGRCGSVLTALQVNKAQLPVLVLVFPGDFNGQGVETGVEDGAGAPLISYLFRVGRHHFINLSLSLSLYPPSLHPLSPPLPWMRTVLRMGAWPSTRSECSSQGAAASFIASGMHIR